MRNAREIEMKYYGMFSDKGNEIVQHVVDIARASEWNWAQTEEFMQMIYENDRKGEGKYLEITDTVVREAVYVELFDGVQ